MDFFHDQLALRKKIRILMLVDIFSKLSSVVDPHFIYRAEDVVATLERICGGISCPKAIPGDQGLEFVSGALDQWTYSHDVMLHFSGPVKPTGNAFIEAFNSKLRSECLNVHWSLTLDDARPKMEE